MTKKIARIAAVAFVLLFVGIIVIADRGEGDEWWSFINQVPYGDKLGHVVLVGTLSLLCNMAFQRPQPGWLPRMVSVTTMVLLVVLSLEEIAQAFLPHRTCDIMDWLADLAGLALGQAIAAKINACLKHGEA